jgi:hypothetical protein
MSVLYTGLKLRDAVTQYFSGSIRLLLTLVLAFYSVSIYSQRQSDLGLTIGTSYYKGDINPSQPFYSPGLNFGVTYRYNLNPRYVLKGEVNYLTLSASDADFTDAFQQRRMASFSSQLYDFAAQFEFNFLPLKFVARKVSFSPFVSSGIAGALVMGTGYSKTFSVAFPFAIGARATIGRKWSVGVNWNFRKLFNDKLDGVENPYPSSMNSVLNNNDWYSFAGVFVTYKMFDFGGNCPAYQENVK